MQGEVAEVEPEEDVLHGDVPVAGREGLGQAEGQAGEWGQRRLGRRAQAEPGLEDVGLEQVEECLVVVILDVDGEAAEGNALVAHVQADEDGEPEDRGLLPLLDTVGRVEVDVFRPAGDLVLGVEVEEHPMHPAARVGGHAHAVEGNLERRILERGVGGDLTRVPDREGVLSG